MCVCVWRGCNAMVTVTGNEHGYLSSNPRRDCLYFTYSWERYESNYSPYSYGQIVRQIKFFNLSMTNSLGEGKLLYKNKHYAALYDIYIYI